MTLNKETFNDLWEAWHKVEREGNMQGKLYRFKIEVKYTQEFMGEVINEKYHSNYTGDEQGAYWETQDIQERLYSDPHVKSVEVNIVDRAEVG